MPMKIWLSLKERYLDRFFVPLDAEGVTRKQNENSTKMYEAQVSHTNFDIRK